jgi:hypothetical protein
MSSSSPPPQRLHWSNFFTYGEAEAIADEAGEQIFYYDCTLVTDINPQLPKNAKVNEILLDMQYKWMRITTPTLTATFKMTAELKIFPDCNVEQITGSYYHGTSCPSLSKTQI